MEINVQFDPPRSTACVRTTPKSGNIGCTAAALMQMGRNTAGDVCWTGSALNGKMNTTNQSSWLFPDAWKR